MHPEENDGVSEMSLRSRRAALVHNEDEKDDEQGGRQRVVVSPPPPSHSSKTIVHSSRSRVGRGAGSNSKLQSSKCGSVRIKNSTAVTDSATSSKRENNDDNFDDPSSSTLPSNAAVPPITPSFGFVGGDFQSGKVCDVSITKRCYAMSYAPPCYCYCCDSSVGHNEQTATTVPTLLAVGLFDGYGVDLYETNTYSLVCTLERHDTVSCLEWLVVDDNNSESDSMLLLAVSGLDGVVTLYHVEMERLESQGATVLHEFQVTGQVRAMTLVVGSGSNNKDKSSSSTILWTVGDKSGTATLCTLQVDYRNHRVVVVVPPPNNNNVRYDVGSAILGMAMNRSATLLAIGTKNGEAIVRRITFPSTKNNGKTKTTTAALLEDEEVFRTQRLGPVRSAAFTRDERCLVFGGYDKTIVVVDTRLWAITRELKVQGTINVLSFDFRERYLAVGARDKSVVLYDTSSWCPLKTIHTPGWVTSISWGTSMEQQDVVAVRSEPTCVPVLDMNPIHMTDVLLSSNDDPESSTSWTRDGRFVARTKGNAVVVADVQSCFTDVARLDTGGYVRCVAFCTATDKSDLLAVINTAGYIFVLRLISTGSKVDLKVMRSSFIEENLWVVAWSADGNTLVAGGREKILHVFWSTHFRVQRDPMKLGGRIWDVDFIPQSAIDSVGERAWMSASMAVATGDYFATLYDGSTFLETLQVQRTRTVRCLKYHPTNPLLAVGDGRNLVAVVDYMEHELLVEFDVHGRVNCLAFSPCGDFLVVGTDDCRFTMHETESYKIVQEIQSSGFATSVSFSPTGEYLLLGCASGEYRVLRLGPLLATELIPLVPTSELNGLPPWALGEALYRSGDGPSLVQRYFLDGSPESVQLAASLLKNRPDALYTFDRTNGEGCFDTALSLQRPNLLKLTLTVLVDGTLESDLNDGGKRSILTTDLPERGAEALFNMIFNHPQLINDILAATTFIKVPFTQPHEYCPKDAHEMGSSSYVDPWYRDDNKLHLGKLDIEDMDIIKSEKRKGTQFRTPAVLPLPGLGKMSFLGALIDNTSASVFDNDAMGLVLRVMWKHHVRKWFLADVFSFIMFYVLWILFVDSTASTTANALGTMEIAEQAIAGTLLALNTLYGLKETIQSARSGRRAAYFRSPWNVVDLLCILLVYSYVLSTAARGGAGNGLVPLVVLATLFLTLKLLSYLRGFGDTGWLISVLRSNFWDIRGFSIVLACCLFGFALAFRVLFGDIEGICIDEACTVDPFGSYARSLISTFELAVLGVYDPAILTDSQYRILSALVFVLAVMCVLVVALNALIAVLSDSYARVQENATANRRFERAELIFQYLCILPKGRREKIEHQTRYFHALLQSDEDGDLMINKEDWQGGLNALRRELQEDQEEIIEANQRAIEQMRNDLSNDISEMHKQMTSLLADVSEEIKELKTMQSKKGLAKNVVRAVKAIA